MLNFKALSRLWLKHISVAFITNNNRKWVFFWLSVYLHLHHYRGATQQNNNNNTISAYKI